jgi:hypothetical protein
MPERNGLRRCRDFCINGKMRNELADFRFSHFFGMLLVVKENKAPDPPDIGAFGAYAEVLNTGNSPDLIEKFGMVLYGVVLPPLILFGTARISFPRDTCEAMPTRNRSCTADPRYNT